MLKKKIPVFVVSLSLLLAACQADQSSTQPDGYPYPSTGEMPVLQPTAYPGSGELPLVQETAYPSPVTDEAPVGSTAEPAYAPQPGDEKLVASSVFPNLEESDLLLLESYPIQVNLVLRGELPTPCNQLRVKVSQPDAEDKIQVEVYSVVDPEKMCIQVIETFETRVSLGSFVSGKYSVYINGEFWKEFTI